MGIENTFSAALSMKTVLARPTIAQLEVFFSSDYLGVMSLFLCIIIMCSFDLIVLCDDTLH